MIGFILFGVVCGFVVSLLVKQEFYKQRCYDYFREKYNEQMDHLVSLYKAEQARLRQNMEDHQELIQAELDKIEQNVWDRLEDTKEVYVSSNMEAMLRDDVV